MRSHEPKLDAKKSKQEASASDTYKTIISQRDRLASRMHIVAFVFLFMISIVLFFGWDTVKDFRVMKVLISLSIGVVIALIYSYRVSRIKVRR